MSGPLIAATDRVGWEVVIRGVVLVVAAGCFTAAVVWGRSGLR